MKKTIIFLTLIIVALIARVQEQRQIINNLSTQVATQVATFERVLDQVEQDNPNYVLDVLSETDAYFNYMEVAR